MRLASAFWVSALLRRADLAGAVAVVRRRGDEVAGAIWVVVDRLDGTIDLHVPAPQSLVDEDASDDRRFETVAARAEPAAVEARIASEVRFDPDLWVVEVEDRAGRSFVEPPPIDPNAPPPARPVWPPRD
ncbi:MAG: DUF1491 family protein [Phyllobacteriaceae bacterium]|nr:DUF1491 family protein [Phyllobacteriaceae bacterium]